MPAGAIDINGSDNGTEGAGIGVIIEKFAYGRNADDAQRNLDTIEITTQLDGDTYRVVVKTPDNDDAGDRGYAGGANLTFNNAGNKEVVITAAAGDISCEDIAGGTIETAAGTVAVGRSRGAIDITAGAGNIAVDRAEGDFTVNAAAGNIVLSAEGGGPRNGSAVCAAGNIDLTLSQKLSCAVDLSVTVGAIEVAGVTDFDSRVSDGGVNVAARFTLNEGAGAITAETAVGTLRVAVQ